VLKKSFGVDFAAYKSATIDRRIKRRLALQGMDSVQGYLDYVKRKPDELRSLFQDLFIGVTEFFRSPSMFQALKRVVFPAILKNHNSDTPVRIWVPGCSTGEEVYSLAICLLEFLGSRKVTPPIQIFGTDVNDEAIKRARIGRYGKEIANNVGRERLRRHFVKVDHDFQVSKRVRDLCVFAKHDILRDPPFSHLDLLSCRNLLIYFNPTTHRKLIPLFHYSLKPSGFLVLGSAETIGGFSDLFFAAKASFIDNYGVDSRYWNSHDENIHQKIRPYLAGDIKDLAAHFHSLARHSKKAEDFDAAVLWYREYLKTFTPGEDAAEMNFLLAECLHDAKRYQAAVAEYEKSAYQYGTHTNAAEAGYAALLTYKQIPEGNEHEQWQLKAIASAIRFSEHFPQDHRVDEVLANTADVLYAMHDYPRTIDVAQRLLARPEQGAAELRRKVWVVLGHARFETGEYDAAQQAYQTALTLLPAKDPQRAGIVENLAAAMYKQGEQRRAAGPVDL